MRVDLEGMFRNIKNNIKKKGIWPRERVHNYLDNLYFQILNDPFKIDLEQTRLYLNLIAECCYARAVFHNPGYTFVCFKELIENLKKLQANPKLIGQFKEHYCLEGKQSDKTSK